MADVGEWRVEGEISGGCWKEYGVFGGNWGIAEGDGGDLICDID
jgi:hypothetical protein